MSSCSYELNKPVSVGLLGWKTKWQEERREKIDGPNPSLVAWLPFNTTGPIITPSPLAAHTHSSSSRELANTLHPPHTWRVRCWICLKMVTRSKETDIRGQCVSKVKVWSGRRWSGAVVVFSFWLLLSVSHLITTATQPKVGLAGRGNSYWDSIQMRAGQ